MKKIIKFLILLCVSITAFDVTAKDEIASFPEKTFINSQEQVVTVDEIIKPNDSTLTTHLQEETNIGEVKITIHNFCSPMLDGCEQWAVLKYKDQFIKHNIQELDAQPLKKESISQQGKFITIEYFPTGAHCYFCGGIDVFKLENDKLIELGVFQGIEGNFLVDVYNTLEINDITSHVDAPIWRIYYSYSNDGKVTLDTNETCNLSEKKDYERHKKELIKSINKSKNKRMKNSEKEATYPDMLYALAFSRWCSFENDYSELISMIRNSSLLDYEKLDIFNKLLNKVKPADNPRQQSKN